LFTSGIILGMVLEGVYDFEKEERPLIVGRA